MLNTIDKQILKLRERLSEFLIDPNDIVFQQGKYLYETQLLAIRAEQEEIDTDDILLVCQRYCQLIAAVGLLRADLLAILELLKE